MGGFPTLMTLVFCLLGNGGLGLAFRTGCAANELPEGVLIRLTRADEAYPGTLAGVKKLFRNEVIVNWRSITGELVLFSH